MTSSVSINTALQQQQKTETSNTKLSQDFDDFLNLLTTQLKNQDPLSPMDTTEFTNQLIGFSGVEQQINMNQKLDSLVALSLSNTMGSALGYVGMDVSYLSAEFNFDGKKPVDITYALEGAAVKSKLRIVDEAGKTVFETEASKSGSKNKFTWDGSLSSSANTKAKSGTYQVKVDAFDANDTLVKSTTVVTGNVHGVETQNGQLYALVGKRAVAISNILNVQKPTTAAGA